MRTRILASIVLTLAAAAFVAAPVNAQQITTCPDGTAPYEVIKGDTIWAKKGLTWYIAWPRLVEMNPWLADRRVDRSADDIYVRLEIGEKICGIEASGLEIRNRNTANIEPPTYNEPTVPVIPATSLPRQPNKVNEAAMFAFIAFLGNIPDLVWWLIAILLLVTLARWWWGFTHPASAGEPLSRDGVDPHNARRVISVATSLGENRYGSLAETSQDTARPRLIGPIETGVVNGIGRVTYRRGLGHTSSLRLMRNEPGFRASFRMPNGTTEQLIFLQGCGNDVSSGMRYTGFTFTPTGVAATVPELQPVIAPPAPRREPPTYGLTQYRRWEGRMKLGGIPITRELVHSHLAEMETRGYNVRILEELLAQRQALIEEEKGYAASAAREFVRARHLRDLADGHEHTARGYERAVRATLDRNNELQPDIDLLSPLPVATVTACEPPASAEVAVNNPNGDGNIG